MIRKLTEEAFHHYVSLGDDRSYRAVAEKFGVSVRAVTKYAGKARWPERLMAIEQRAREELDAKLQEELVETNQRHLKVFRFVQAKAIEVIKSTPMESVTEALRAYIATVDRERVLRGQPSDRIEHRVEDLTKREIQRLVGHADEADDLDDDNAGDEAEDEGVE